ncbi:hypothetical protein D3C72_2556420 [compost metagenome]
MFKADQKESALACGTLRLVQPRARAPAQLLLAKEASQFIARQAAAQRAFPADEKQTYRC